MENKDLKQKSTEKKKGFLKGLLEKLDKALIEKSKHSSCCGSDSKGKRCC